MILCTYCTYGAVKNEIAGSAPPGKKFRLSSSHPINIPERRPPIATVMEGFIVIIINTFRPKVTRCLHKYNIIITNVYITYNMLAYPANVVQVPIYTGELSYKYRIYIYMYVYVYTVRLPVQENKSHQISPELTAYNTSV